MKNPLRQEGVLFFDFFQVVKNAVARPQKK